MMPYEMKWEFTWLLWMLQKPNDCAGMAIYFIRQKTDGVLKYGTGPEAKKKKVIGG